MIEKFFQLITGPVARVAEQHIARKANKDTLKAKASMARMSGEHQVALTDSEWEVVSKQLEKDSWKDELATLVVLYPLIGIMVGTTVAAFTGETQLLDGTVAGIEALKTVGVDMGELMLIVVLAAVSLKWWRKAGS